MLHYKTRQMMDGIEAIRRDDPDSVIVVFGDHLPMLGRKFAGYVESGVLPDNFGAFTGDQYDFSASTPLLVIDGRNGPLDLGRIPMYRLPARDPAPAGRGAARPSSIWCRCRTRSSRVRLPDVMMTYQGGVPHQLCKARRRRRPVPRRPPGSPTRCCSTTICSPAASMR